MLPLAEPEDGHRPLIGSDGKAGRSAEPKGSVHWLGRSPVLVSLIDDRALFRDSLAAALNTVADIKVQPASPADAGADLPATLRGMHVVLITMDRPGLTKGPCGAVLARVLALEARPAVAVIVGRISRALRREASRLGVDALLTTENGLSALAEDLRRLRAQARP